MQNQPTLREDFWARIFFYVDAAKRDIEQPHPKESWWLRLCNSHAVNACSQNPALP